MVKTIQQPITQNKFLLLLLVFLLSMLNVNAQSNNPRDTEYICVAPGTQNTSLNATSFNYIVIGTYGYKWYKKVGNSFTYIGDHNPISVHTTSADDGTTTTYSCTYKIHIFGIPFSRELHVVVSKSMPNIMSGLSVDTNNCNLIKINFTATPTDQIRYNWGLGTVVGQNTVQSNVSDTSLNLNTYPLGNHNGVWVQKKHVNCDPNESRVISLNRISNLRIAQQTCNNGSVLKLAVDGPNNNQYTWKYRDHNNVMHTLTTSGGREYTVPVAAHPVLGNYTFFVTHATATVCGNPLSVVVNPRVAQATSITAVNLCNRIQLTAHGQFDLSQPYIFKWVKLNNGNGSPMTNQTPIITTVPYVLLTDASGNTTYRVEVYIGSESTSSVCGSFATVNFNVGSGTNLQVAASVTNISNSCSATASHITLQLNSNHVQIKRWESRRTNVSAWTTIPNQTSNAIDVVQLGFAESEFPRFFRAVYEVLDDLGNVLCEGTTAQSNQVNYTTGNNIRYYTGGTFTNSNYIDRQLVLNANYTLASDLTVCSITVSSGKTLTIPAGRTLTVTNNVNVLAGGQLLIQDKGALIQIDDAAINQVNGVFKHTVKSAPVTKFDYTYWSSPVRGFTLNALSPNTLQDKYHSFDPNTAAGWVNHIGGAVVMTPGKGYIVRSPQSFSTSVAANYIAEFSGTPNTGTVSVPVYRGNSANQGNNLVGNPYPSSLDISKFLQYNSSVIEGYVELWSHQTPLSNQTTGPDAYNYSQADYVKYNLTGNTFSSHPALLDFVPEGVVATGQSFMVTFNNSAGTMGEVIFKNDMRKTNVGANFFRYAYETESEQSQNSGDYLEVNPEQRDRLWLHITKNSDDFKQTLIGYVRGATNQTDHYFDAPVTDLSNPVNLYSLLEDSAMNIQGRAWPLNAADRVPLGYKVSSAGEFTIGLGMYDGIFSQDQGVYLYDHLLAVLHDLKEGDYSFMSAPGQFNNRFEVRYQPITLGQTVFDNSRFIAFSQQQQLFVQSPKAIQNIRLFDLTGRLLYQADAHGNLEFESERISVAQQMVVLKIQFVDGSQQSQKLPFN